MTLIHYLSMKSAYKQQWLSLSRQQESMFHAYHLVCYTGMLRCFCSRTSHQLPVTEIVNNDARRCSKISAQALNKALVKLKREDISAVTALSGLCSSFMGSFERVRADAAIVSLVDMLHVASLVIYRSLRSAMLADECVYKEIQVTEDLLSFCRSLTPPVDLFRHACSEDVIVAESNLLIIWKNAVN
jgi:hypothetical protein